MERIESKAILRARTVSLDDILFEVEQVELDEQRTILTQHDFGGQYASAIYSPDLNRVLHLAGRQYQLITNRQLIYPIYDKLVDMFGYGGIKATFRSEDDRRFSADFVLNDKTIQVAQKDFVNMMITVQNSYDGSLRHSIGLSYLRQICTNGLMGWRKESLVQHKHNNDFLPNLDEILARLDNLDSQMNNFRKLTERQVTHKEIEKILERLSATKDSFPKKILSEVPFRMHEEAERLETKPNAWLLYNGFNYFLNHDSRIGMGMDIKEKVDRQIVSVIKQELALN